MDLKFAMLLNSIQATLSMFFFYWECSVACLILEEAQVVNSPQISWRNVVLF